MTKPCKYEVILTDTVTYRTCIETDRPMTVKGVVRKAREKQKLMRTLGLPSGRVSGHEWETYPMSGTFKDVHKYKE